MHYFTSVTEGHCCEDLFEELFELLEGEFGFSEVLFEVGLAVFEDQSNEGLFGYVNYIEKPEFAE